MVKNKLIKAKSKKSLENSISLTDKEERDLVKKEKINKSKDKNAEEVESSALQIKSMMSDQISTIQKA